MCLVSIRKNDLKNILVQHMVLILIVGIYYSSSSTFLYDSIIPRGLIYVTPGMSYQVPGIIVCRG